MQFMCRGKKEKGGKRERKRKKRKKKEPAALYPVPVSALESSPSGCREGPLRVFLRGDG